MIKVISFDVGGTLIQFERGGSLKRTLMNAFDVDAGILEQEYRKHFTEGKNSFKDFCNNIQYDNPSEIEKIIETYYTEKPLGVLYPEVIHVLSTLKEMNYYLMVISNKSYCNPSSLSTYHLDDYLDTIIYSYQVGCAKPGRAIFQYAQNIANVNADEILHVGDSMKADIIGAHRVNWHTALINRTMKKQDGVIQPDYSITSMEQILSIVENDRMKKG